MGRTVISFTTDELLKNNFFKCGYNTIFAFCFLVSLKRDSRRCMAEFYKSENTNKEIKINLNVLETTLLN